MTDSNKEWTDLARRAAFASHQLIGWIYWDPRAAARHAELGVKDGLGHYIANRAAPLAAAGVDAVTAAFGSIDRFLIHFSLDIAADATTWDKVYAARNATVGEGLRDLAPEICDGLAALRDELWRTVDAMPSSGRVLFAAHRAWPRADDDPVVSAWLAVNALREWRGDTHWGLLSAHAIDGVEAGLLHDAWMGYPKEWIPRSRGANDDQIAAALSAMGERGWITDGVVNAAGIEFRQWLEEETNRLCARCWHTFGHDNTVRFLSLVEPVGQRFVEHIDATAGPNWMPAARPRRV
ncbi:MAG: hypothetical protein KJS66_10200 [Acidobacteria bacterium]|nr:hypothetical protein [Acidobacteriota bacterium]